MIGDFNKLFNKFALLNEQSFYIAGSFFYQMANL